MATNTVDLSLIQQLIDDRLGDGPKELQLVRNKIDNDELWARAYMRLIDEGGLTSLDID